MIMPPEPQSAAGSCPIRHYADAFGLRWASDRPIPCFALAKDTQRSSDVEVVYRRELSKRPGGTRVNNGELFDDGTRFRFEDMMFDMFDGNRIEWCGPSDSAVPMTLGGTITAHLLAWRGLVPLHGSAVAFGDEALLVAGPSGAGKSTLADALVRCGGRLISDDLSVLVPPADGQPPQLVSGRPAIRLAHRLGEQSDTDKRLSLPPRTAPDGRYRLSAMLVLSERPAPSGIAAAFEILIRQLFRPAWMDRLPHRRTRSGALLNAAAHVRILTMPPASAAHDMLPDARAAQALELWRGTLSAGQPDD